MDFQAMSDDVFYGMLTFWGVAAVCLVVAIVSLIMRQWSGFVAFVAFFLVLFGLGFIPPISESNYRATTACLTAAGIDRIVNIERINYRVRYILNQRPGQPDRYVTSTYQWLDDGTCAVSYPN